jgi:DNA-binding transcriptional ArsR family regulator
MKVNLETMQNAAGEASTLLKGLANPHRLMIVCQLIEGPRSVGQLAAFLGLRDSTVSQHLALMRREGLVATRREGQTIWYAIASPAARAVIETLFALYCAPGQKSRPANRTKRSGR